MTTVAGGHGGPVYSVGLLRKVAIWSVPMAVAVALVGSAVSSDPGFGVSCLVGAAFDVGTLYWAMGRTNSLDPREALPTGPFVSFFLLRLAIKAALLVVAAVFSPPLNVLGMAAGVVIVDLTLVTAGSAAAAWHTLRPHQPGG